MFRNDHADDPHGVSFLCLRRGVSPDKRIDGEEAYFSLPTQRCFRAFSAFPRLRQTFLCLRRGVSHHGRTCREDFFFSLPTQRCFYFPLLVMPVLTLFSAYAEVFPTSHGWMTAKCPLFSAYAEVFPAPAIRSPGSPNFSLPTQRCF